MQTIKDVLNRQEEQNNLKNMLLCALMVFILIAVSFGVFYTKFFFRSDSDNVRSGKTNAERMP